MSDYFKTFSNIQLNVIWQAENHSDVRDNLEKSSLLFFSSSENTIHLFFYLVNEIITSFSTEICFHNLEQYIEFLIIINTGDHLMKDCGRLTYISNILRPAIVITIMEIVCNLLAIESAKF